MIHKANIRPAWVVLVLLLGFALLFIFSKSPNAVSAQARQSENEKITGSTVDLTKFKNAKENEICFVCHGQSKYTYENKDSKKIVIKKMYSEVIIKRDVFYSSNHREFKCTDCHSEDYTIFPHSGNLRMESKAGCIDCHGGDEKYAKFKFEKIEKEFQESVHSQTHSEDFTCWMCHNAHSYKINARTNENRQETITYDNLICLNCHGDIQNYQLLTDKQKPNLIEKHDWLPNQVSHFTSVRCIECHAKNVDTLVVAHEVVPKNQAVRKCESCHSKNSILYASLFKYQIDENIHKKGLIRGLFFSETATIGPDQNDTLNKIGLAIFALTIIIILIHAYLRIKK